MAEPGTGTRKAEAQALCGLGCIVVATIKLQLGLFSSQASPCPKEANRALLSDSSCWTIIGTESVEFSFSTSLSCTREPVTPVPVIGTLEVKLGAGAGAGAGVSVLVTRAAGP